MNLTTNGYALVNGELIRLAATGEATLREMVVSIGYTNRTPEETVAAFDDFDTMDAEIEDPFPFKPSYEESEEMKVGPDEIDDITTFAEANREWYDAAPYVAARMFIETAREHDEFREKLLEDDEFGAGHAMAEYDGERMERLNSMGLSAFQGGSAENIARKRLGGFCE